MRIRGRGVVVAAFASCLIACSAEVIDDRSDDGGDGHEGTGNEGTVSEGLCAPAPASPDPSENCAAYCELYACVGCSNEAACVASCEAYVNRPRQACELELLACAAAHIDELTTSVSCDQHFDEALFTLTFPLDHCSDCPAP